VLSIHITITTLNVELARILEPRAPRPDLRMAAVREISEAGINVGVSCSPVLPGITDSPADLEALVRDAAAAGARHIFANPLFLKPCSAAVFYLSSNRSSTTGRELSTALSGSGVPAGFVQQAYRTVDRALPQKYGIKRADPRQAKPADEWAVQGFEEQLTLF